MYMYIWCFCQTKISDIYHWYISCQPCFTYNNNKLV